MVRGISAFVLATMLSFTGFARAQEALPHAHDAAGHGGHEHAAHEHGTEEMAMEEGYEPPRSQNFLMWLISALGVKYVLFLPASALLSFALTAALVLAGKGRTTGAAVGFIVAIPFLIGIFGMFEGLMSSFMVIAASTSSPKPSQIAEGVSMSIVTPLVGMLLMVPSYLLATVGLSIRAFQNDPKP